MVAIMTIDITTLPILRLERGGQDLEVNKWKKISEYCILKIEQKKNENYELRHM